MGSESQTILGNVAPYAMQDEVPIPTQGIVDSLREEIMLGLKAEMEKFDMVVRNKMTQIEQRVKGDLSEKVTNLQDKVEEMHIVVEKVQADTKENINAMQLAVDKMMENQNLFFSNIKNLLKKS